MYKQSQTLAKIIDCTACDELNNKFRMIKIIFKAKP